MVLSRAFQRMVRPYLLGRGCRGPLGSAPARARPSAGGGHGGAVRSGRGGAQRAESAAKVATQASAEFQLMATSLVEYE